MKQAVAKCPWADFKYFKNTIPSLLDSGSMVSIVRQDYFDHYIKPNIGPAKGQDVSAHNLFKLKGSNEGDILITYFDMNVKFLGLQVPKGGFLFAKIPTDLLVQDKILNCFAKWGMEPDEKSTSGDQQKYTDTVFENFECLTCVDQLLFTLLCVYYYTDMKTTVRN